MFTPLLYVTQCVMDIFIHWYKLRVVLKRRDGEMKQLFPVYR